MRAGEMLAQGVPEDLLTPGFIDEVFQVPCIVINDPLTGKPLVIPKRAPRAG
jgi:iron complex transport system ATP-binding protein